MATITDLVLVHIDGKPGFFARIEDITPDVKPGWWQVKLLVLNLPLQLYTWILDDSQINGAPFTMGGTPVQIEKVISPLTKGPAEDSSPPKKDGASGGVRKDGKKVVSLLDRKKEK